jgi:hypothetical protein
MRGDFKVWLSFLTQYNSVTLMLEDLWTSNESIELFTENAEYCIFCYFSIPYCLMQWLMRVKIYIVNHLEMYIWESVKN